MINDVSTRLGGKRGGSPRQIARGFTLVELLVVIGVILLLIALLLPAARRSVEAGRQVTCLNHMRQIAQAALMYCQDNDGTFPGMCGLDPPLPHEWVYWESKLGAPYNDPTRSPIMRYLGSHSIGATPDPTQADLTVLRCPSDDWQSHTEGMVEHPTLGNYPFSYAINIFTATWLLQPSPGGWLKNSFAPVIPAFRLSEVKNLSQTMFFLEEDPRYIDDGTFMNVAASFGWSEPASYVHDTNRSGFIAPQPYAGVDKNNLDHARRTNVVFCDGHGDFVTQEFLEEQAHYDPRY